MVTRAGLPLQDLEFVQFHPTGIYGLCHVSPLGRETRSISRAAEFDDSIEISRPHILTPPQARGA